MRHRTGRNIDDRIFKPTRSCVDRTTRLIKCDVVGRKVSNINRAGIVKDIRSGIRMKQNERTSTGDGTGVG